MRKKDVVLMATVTSFESLTHPSKSELRQFAELFAPLFSASTDDARRQAVAALSQSPNIPSAVAFFIGCQPIAIAAPFLTASTCLSDETLIAIARSQGLDHARAIVRREALSVTVIDALAGLRHERTARDERPSAGNAETDAERLAREEELRRRLKLMAAHINRAPSDRLGLHTLSPTQVALIVRFARNREASLLAAVMSDILGTSRWLIERVMLDLSGQQMATVLKSLGLEALDGCYVLIRLYGHLAEEEHGVSQAQALWAGLDEDECAHRVDAWKRADRYTHGLEAEPGAAVEEAGRDRPMRTSASLRRSAGGQRHHQD